MRYFTLNEFIKSDKAEQLHIDNTPKPWQVDNITELVDTLLDPLREAWAEYCIYHELGKPGIKVTSGIRSKELNEAIGGSPTSAHYYGYAVDLVPSNGKLRDFKKFCWNWLLDKDFDQFISESEDRHGVPRWIHIGIRRGDGSQRRQFMYMKYNKYYSLGDIKDPKNSEWYIRKHK